MCNNKQMAITLDLLPCPFEVKCTATLGVINPFVPLPCVRPWWGRCVSSFGCLHFCTNCLNKCVSRLVRRKSHHTALSSAAAPNSTQPRRPIPTAHCDFYIAHLGSHTAAVTPRQPKFTKWEKTCPDSSPTRMQNCTSLPPLRNPQKPNSITLSGSNQLRTSFELAPKQLRTN